MMYDELKERCRACSQGCIYPSECSYFNKPPFRCMRQLLSEAADAIEELQKAVLRLEDESGILDELPMVDQSTRCDTCVHKGNVDFDYCHICNNEADMYKPKPPKEES